jgi:putative DNA primase/helicase
MPLLRALISQIVVRAPQEMIASLKSLAAAVGGEVVGTGVVCPGPGHGPRDRSLSVTLSASSPDGFLCFSHAGDNWRTCRDHVRERLGIPDEAWKHETRACLTLLPKIAAPIAAPPDDDPERIARAIGLWRSSINARGTLVEKYLHSRGLELADDIANDIRWASDTGAMISLFRNIESGRPQAVSRTYLDASARKIDRKFLGLVGGAAIMLDGFDDVLSGLHIGEGIETCMAARQLGLRPSWALGSKGAIGAFPVLAGVEALTILAEPDAEKETQICAARWHAAGREVIINRSRVGKDLNDALLGAA